MIMRHMTAFAFVLATSVAGAGAQEFQIVKVASVTGSTVDSLKPKTIVFNDHRVDETSDKGAFIKYEEWARTKPLERRFLSLFPKFSEGMIHRIVDGSKKEMKDELQMYVTEARIQAVPAGCIDRP